VAGKGTFVNSLNVHTIETSDTNTLIGIALPHRNDQLSSNILIGVERVLRDKGYGLVYTNLENRMDKEKEQVLHLKAQRVAGIIFFPLAAPGESQLLCSLLGQTPMVLVDRELSDFCGSVVMADHFQGAYQATRHLLDLGHTRIVVITHPSQASSVLERRRGYEQAMRDGGLLPYAPIPLLDFGDKPPNIPPVYSKDEMIWIDHMLSISEPPSAAFCVNDNLATGVMRLALDRGLRIPEDFAVVGFDNSQFAPLCPVPLTSIEQNGIEMGAKAAELLLCKIANPHEKDQKILLPVRLVLRASSVKGA
jgi:DNA-binding LacI/PurR family transcriptional regulator